MRAEGPVAWHGHIHPAPSSGWGRVAALPRAFGSENVGPESEGSPTRMMRAYELMVIVDGDVEDAQAQAWTKFVTDEIGKAGGSVHGKPDWWGKRAYAYPINKKEAGYYLVIECAAEGGALDELERQLRLADDIVRHKLIRLPESEAARRGIAVSAA